MEKWVYLKRNESDDYFKNRKFPILRPGTPVFQYSKGFHILQLPWNFCLFG